jgi:hypothetical protein
LGVYFGKLVWLSWSDVVMSWLRREVHPTSISYVYKLFQHLGCQFLFSGIYVLGPKNRS